jgi:glyoxylase I family protein
MTDVERSVAFYTGLGFKLEHQQLPAFASVSLGDAQMLLSGPEASGSRPMPNGQRQEPGGWNRVVPNPDRGSGWKSDRVVRTRANR